MFGLGGFPETTWGLCARAPAEVGGAVLCRLRRTHPALLQACGAEMCFHPSLSLHEVLFFALEKEDRCSWLVQPKKNVCLASHGMGTPRMLPYSHCCCSQDGGNDRGSSESLSGSPDGHPEPPPGSSWVPGLSPCWPFTAVLQRSTWVKLVLCDEERWPPHRRPGI